MSRTAELLTAAANALDDGQDPFSTGFLVDHAVTFDECMTMGEMLAVGARLVAFAIDNPQAADSAVTGAHAALVRQALGGLSR